MSSILRLSPKKTRRALWALVGIAGALSGCTPKATVPAKPPEQAQYEQGVRLLHDGKLREAQAAFDTAMRLNAGYTPPYLAKAELAARTGDMAQAITLLETLRRAAPQTPHIVCRLAELHAASGRFVEAVAAAKLALAQEPDCPLARTEYALQEAAAGNRKEAITRMQAVHESDPQNQRATLLLAQLLARDNRPEAAWKLLDSLPAAPALPAQTDYLCAWLLAEYGRNGKRDAAQARTLLDRVLAQAPDDGPANLEKGRILQRAGDARGALLCLQKAQKNAPPSFELLSAVAETQARLKHPDAARMKQSALAFGKLVDSLYTARQRYLTDPDNRDNLVKLARLEATMGNPQDAEALLTQVLKRNPNDVEALELMTPRSEVVVPPTRKTPSSSASTSKPER